MYLMHDVSKAIGVAPCPASAKAIKFFALQQARSG
jgi:hypothetical protein